MCSMTVPVIASIRTWHLVPAWKYKFYNYYIPKINNIKLELELEFFFLQISTDRSSTDFPSLYFWFFSWAVSWGEREREKKNHQNDNYNRNIYKPQIFIFLALNLTYVHPTIDPQPTQKMSATVCSPVIIILSSFSPRVMFTLSKNEDEN